MKVTLLTSDGRFVHEAEILPFTSYPDVLLWGDRVFQLDPQKTGGNYRECFFAIVIDRDKWTKE